MRDWPFAVCGTLLVLKHIVCFTLLLWYTQKERQLSGTKIEFIYLRQNNRAFHHSRTLRINTQTIRKSRTHVVYHVPPPSIKHGAREYYTITHRLQMQQRVAISLQDDDLLYNIQCIYTECNMEARYTIEFWPIFGVAWLWAREARGVVVMNNDYHRKFRILPHYYAYMYIVTSQNQIDNLLCRHFVWYFLSKAASTLWEGWNFPNERVINFELSNDLEIYYTWKKLIKIDTKKKEKKNIFPYKVK